MKGVMKRVIALFKDFMYKIRARRNAKKFIDMLMQFDLEIMAYGNPTAIVEFVTIRDNILRDYELYSASVFMSELLDYVEPYLADDTPIEHEAQKVKAGLMRAIYMLYLISIGAEFDTDKLK